MSKITIFVGDIHECAAALAVQYDPNAKLLDNKNYNLVFESHECDVTFYTSLKNLSKDISLIMKILNLADQIFYCNHDGAWSDNKKIDLTDVTASLQGLTEFILFQINHLTNKVQNLNLDNYSPTAYLRLVDSRISDKNQLWVAGGSDVFGVGVEPAQRFGHILGEQLNLPVSFLAVPGSSIEFQADQILRSDICKNDIIVWGLPPEHRVPYWSDIRGEIVHLNRMTNQKHRDYITISVDVANKLIADRTCFFQSLVHIHQVINFCNKVQAKLLIVGITISDTLAIHLHNLPNFFNYSTSYTSTQYIDLGSDNFHPGPKQHQSYANFCQEKLKKLNYIL
jgi:hypothetical protein